jgi:hypothetical protein
MEGTTLTEAPNEPQIMAILRPFVLFNSMGEGVETAT